MGNQESKPIAEPADHEKDATTPSIKYSLELLLDSDQEYQRVVCNPTSRSLSFHPAETSSPIIKSHDMPPSQTQLLASSFDVVS